jgi:hypothetical protein
LCSQVWMRFKSGRRETTKQVGETMISCPCPVIVGQEQEVF